jgi:hypothetical protein
MDSLMPHSNHPWLFPQPLGITKRPHDEVIEIERQHTVAHQRTGNLGEIFGGVVNCLCQHH